MAEINKKDLEKAFDQLQNIVGRRRNASIDEHADVNAAKAAAEEVGQRNFTALGDKECAEFFDAKTYQDKIMDYTHTVTSTTRAGREFKSLYALVNRFRITKVGGKTKRIGEHPAFVDVGNLVQHHYDVAGIEKTAEGTYPGATRVVTPGQFNEALNEYQLPWAMLTEFLAGKIIQANRTDKKEMFQHFEGGTPVQDKYDYRNTMELSFIK